MNANPALALVLLAATLASSGPCSAAPSDPASTGRTATVEEAPEREPIPIGATAHFEGSRIVARFVRVVQDSRCPTGVECVWAGRAVVEVEASIEGSEAPSHLLELEVGGTPAEVYGARLQAARLEPYPSADATLAEDQYRLELRLLPAGEEAPARDR